MSLCYDFQKWTIVSMLSVATSLTVGLLLINFAHGQVIDAKFANCIIIWTDSQVVLGTDDDCSGELFSQAVSYYKSQGYSNVGSYSNFLGEQAISLNKALEQSRQMREDTLNQSAKMGEDYGGVKYCSDFEERNFKVQPGDPYNLDLDGDGIACED